jgi:agmatinase
MGFRAVHVTEMDQISIPAVIDLMLERVKDRAVYVSIDIDVMDPAFAPGTGTPEAGGISSRELLRVIRSLDKVNLVGADIVEVAPAYDHAQVTGIAASHLAYELVTLMARRKENS